ncbi:MAG: amidase [Alphaproteobacteria bacterium]|jgi:aspartyl-tRNA(Asn)/glutamyl-tRNA(Gln) amidotransferase subunit A
MSDELAYLSANDMIAAFRNKNLSPVEVAEASLARIEAHNGLLNAFCLVDNESALASARDSEARWAKGEPLGLLDGVPVGVKDLVLTKGWPTLRGSKTTDPDQDWDEDGPATARLRESGAVLLGKTTSCEFGWKGVTDSALCGITRNPWNPERTPGGSSGGSAAAVASGMVPLAVGTDGGGSIRIPCGFTGLAGIKPSYSRVPAYPASSFGALSHVGPMARTVADAALMLSVLARPDWRDYRAMPEDIRDWRDGIEDGVAGLRIGYSPDLGHAQVDGEVAEITARTAQTFVGMGAVVEEVSLDLAHAADCFRTLWFSGAASALRSMSEEQRKIIDPGLVEVATEGAGYSALDLLGAEQMRAGIALTMAALHQDYDLLLTPGLPIPAFEAGVEVPPGSGLTRWPEWTPFSYPFNLTGQPAAVVPCGFTADGLPVSLQIVGPRHQDALTLRAARAYEAVCPTTGRRPDL